MTGTTRKKKRSKKPLWLLLIVAIVIVAGLGSFYVLTSPVNRTATKEILVQIPEGSSTKKIASLLRERGVIRSKTAFLLQAKLSGKAASFQAGTYAVRRSMNAGALIRLIASGKTAGNTFTLTEGMPLYKIAAMLSKEGIMTEQAFYHEVEHGSFEYEFMSSLPKGSDRLEGYLYPDTYRVDPEATPHEIINQMLQNFDRRIGSRRGQYRTVIKASIIQKEAGNASEMKKVSSVIDNRIRAGMPLQMDSILSYLHKEDKIRASYEDLKVDSDYNPYTNKGLPPGPICSPGKQAIDAALHPAKTKYLYFVASPDMDGTNVFSETYEEFRKNKKSFDRAYEQYVKTHPGAK